MKRVLVAYGTNAGSTKNVAAAVGQELWKSGAQVDVRRIRDVRRLHDYASVVVGGPIIFSAWHTDAINFVKLHQPALSEVPVAYFMTGLHLIQTAATRVDEVPVFLDPAIATPPRRAGHLSFTERHSTIERYLAPVLQKAPLIKPVSVGFFAGKMDYRTLTLTKRLFAQVVIRKPGDFRNWAVIRAWAADLQPLLPEIRAATFTQRAHSHM